MKTFTQYFGKNPTVWAPEAFKNFKKNIYEVGSVGGGASNTPQLKALGITYLTQVVSRLGLQLQVTTFPIKLCYSYFYFYAVTY